MANPDGNPNPNIAEAGKATQFGQPGGPDPSKVTGGGYARWSVRGALRYLGALDIDLNNDVEVALALGRKPTNAQKVAIKQLLKAQKEDADTRAAEFVDERIEGKLPQSNVNANLNMDGEDEDAADIAAIKKSLLRGLVPDVTAGGETAEDKPVDGSGTPTS